LQERGNDAPVLSRHFDGAATDFAKLAAQREVLRTTDRLCVLLGVLPPRATRTCRSRGGGAERASREVSA